MSFILGIGVGILLSICWEFYRYMAERKWMNRAGHQYIVDILSTNEGIEYARKFLYVCPTSEWDMYNHKQNEKNMRFSLYAPLRNWYENC